MTEILDEHQNLQVKKWGRLEPAKLDNFLS